MLRTGSAHQALSSHVPRLDSCAPREAAKTLRKHQKSFGAGEIRFPNFGQIDDGQIHFG